MIEHLNCISMRISLAKDIELHTTISKSCRHMIALRANHMTLITQVKFSSLNIV